MIRQIEPVLYTDPQQQQRPTGRCIRCGGECYGSSELCTDCGAAP